MSTNNGNGGFLKAKPLKSEGTAPHDSTFADNIISECGSRRLLRRPMATWSLHAQKVRPSVHLGGLHHANAILKEVLEQVLDHSATKWKILELIWLN